MDRSEGKVHVWNRQTPGAVGVGKGAMSDLVLNLQKKPTVGPEATLAADIPHASESSGASEHSPRLPTGAELTEFKTAQGAPARPEDFTHFESVLASRMGVNRQILREKRKAATEGEHWSWVGGNRVCWSEAGLVWLENALRAPRNDRGVDPSPESSTAGNEQDAHAALAKPAQKTAVRQFSVVRTFLSNPRLLLATDGLNMVRVRVRNSAGFVKDMLIPCRPVHDDVWELARPCPRWRGKW